MKPSTALCIFSASLLSASMWPDSSHASEDRGEVDFQAGVTTIVAEGGAFPVAHLGLRVPLGSGVGLDLRLDTIGIAGALQASIDVPLLWSENGHHRIGLRGTAANAYAADVFGGTLLVAMFSGGVQGSLSSRDVKTSLSIEAGFAASGILGRSAGSGPPEPTGFVLRPELNLEFFSDEVVRPFLGACAFIHPEFVFGAATLGARW